MPTAKRACAASLLVAASLLSFRVAAVDLRPPSSFDAIADRAERSRSIFAEAGKVIQSPRCLNCHPVGDRPTQGRDMHPHNPPVFRGADDRGAVGMRCTTCHQSANFDASGVPGNPSWHLAPALMAWQHETLGEICAQIKDSRRNGGRTLAQIQEHMAHDVLVGWGWHPGGMREPAPGTQESFGELIAAWIATGAECPV
jgi:hypothetical protein